MSNHKVSRRKCQDSFALFEESNWGESRNSFKISLLLWYVRIIKEISIFDIKLSNCISIILTKKSWHKNYSTISNIDILIKKVHSFQTKLSMLLSRDFLMKEYIWQIILNSFHGQYHGLVENASDIDASVSGFDPPYSKNFSKLYSLWCHNSHVISTSGELCFAH